MKDSRNFLALLGILALATVLRFWQLELKPLWLDEVLTALFSLGHGYRDIPKEVWFPLSQLNTLFTLQPTSCAQIVQTVTQQSTHPPLFFCWMQQWLSWLNGIEQPLVWKLRSFSALAGVAAIAAVYQLNRIAFSVRAGLMAAALMAVSPFALYLSQEARHYTLPMLLIALALLGLVRIQQDLHQQRINPGVWLGWVAVNCLGFYVHYFFAFCVVAQCLTLLGLLYQRRDDLPRRCWAVTGLAIAGIGLSYLPWLPVLLQHLNSPATGWIKASGSSWTQTLAPLYQLPISWVLMVIALPVENQPLWISVPLILVMLLFTSWLLWHSLRGLRQLLDNGEAYPAAVVLISYCLCVLLEFLAMIYLAGKDLTQAPRYNFIYYPAIAALLGASLVNVPRKWQRPRRSSSWLKSPTKRQVQALTLLVGLVSCLCVTSNLAFQKPSHPSTIAGQMQPPSPFSLLATIAYQENDLQDIAMGLSFALELQKQVPAIIASNIQFSFLARSPNYQNFWQNLTALYARQSALHPPFYWWIFTRALSRKDHLPIFTPNLSKAETRVNCTPAPTTPYYRIGIPYQRYQCKSQS